MCDFGFACLSDATKITATGAWAGTPLYMAPEQIRGEPVDNRTVAFSPDGKTLAMGDADGDDPTSSLPLWELP